MTMSRQHFKLIADVLKREHDRVVLSGDSREYHSSVEAIAYEFADELARTNPRFNRTRFLEACGVEVR